MANTGFATKTLRWVILLALLLFAAGIAASFWSGIGSNGADAERVQELNDPNTLPRAVEPPAR